MQGRINSLKIPSTELSAWFCLPVNALLVFPIAVLACVNALWSNAQDVADKVVVRAVVERKVDSARRIVGDVVPLRKSTIGSAVAGRVVEFLIDQGVAVKEGQPLAQLRTETLGIELAAAQAELLVYQQRLAELKNGALPEDIAEARAKLLGAEAVMKNTAARVKRITSLRETSAVSEDEYGDKVERAEAARQLFLAAEAALKRVENGPRPEQIAQAEAQVQLQQQQIKLIEDRIAKHTITAPFDGYVSAEHTEVGAWIQQGDPVAEVIQLNAVDVRAPVPAEQALRLSLGQPIRIEFPERNGEIFVGRLKRVVPAADPRTRTFPLYIRLDNPIDNGAPRLMAGMLARVNLPTGEKRSLSLVPKDAIVLDGRRQVVLVVEGASKAGDSGVVRSAAVELGVADGELIQVSGSLQAGDLVVVLGNERLDHGSPVKIAQVQVDASASSAAEAQPKAPSAPAGR